MLVVCNGAPKGGSTWQVQIIEKTKVFQRIPEKYQKEKWANSSLEESRFEEFFANAPYQTENYFVKQHWRSDPKYLALADDEHVKILNIVRDIRDVLVSRFFHDQMISKTEAKDVESYYWQCRGKQNVVQYINYQIFWNELTTQGKVYRCSYEGLKNDFVSTVREMLHFIGLDFSDSAIQGLQEETTIKKYTKFFRKGIVGDWKNHLKSATVEDIDQICQNSGYYELNVQGKCKI